MPEDETIQREDVKRVNVPVAPWWVVALMMLGLAAVYALAVQGFAGLGLLTPAAADLIALGSILVVGASLLLFIVVEQTAFRRVRKHLWEVEAAREDTRQAAAALAEDQRSLRHSQHEILKVRNQVTQLGDTVSDAVAMFRTQDQRIGALEDEMGDATGIEDRLAEMDRLLVDMRRILQAQERRTDSIEQRVTEESERRHVTIQDPAAVGNGGDETFETPSERPIEDIQGVGDVYGGRLRKAGVRTIGDLERADPGSVANKAAVRPRLVREWSAMADLMHVPGIGPQYSEPLVRTNVSSVRELAATDPQQLYARVRSVMDNQKMPLNRGRIGVDLVTRWVHSARALVAPAPSVPALR